MLFLRILSALIGIPVVIAAVYFGGPWFALFILLVVNAGIYEYNRVTKIGNFSFLAVIAHLGVSFYIIIMFFEQHLLITPLLLLLFFIMFVAALFNMENMGKTSIADSAMTMWGIIYIGVLCGYILMLRMQPDGAFYTYLLFVGVWIHDTMAYFIGVKWGMRKFAPQISPKKSVEGSLAGLSGTIVIFFSASILAPGFFALTPWGAIIFALGIAVFAQLGDLMESALKRQMQVKDSGAVIPGHGGVLDRFDSIMLAAPFVYYFFILVSVL